MNFSIANILQAQVRLQSHVVNTPLLESPMLNTIAGCRLLVKAECLQRTGAFKFRGALNKILTLDIDQVQRGVITFSAGNHGHAVAAAAHAVGCPAVVVLPCTAAKIKIENCRWWGAEVVFYDPQTEDREAVVSQIIGARGLTFVHPFDDLEVMAGQGTCGLEIAEQLQALSVTPDDLVLCCSGGGLASGVTEAIKHRFPQVRVWIVEPVGYEKMARSLLSGKPERNVGAPQTLLDGISGPVAGTQPLKVLRQHGAKGLSVSDGEALEAMAQAFLYLKLVLEPGGAAALAAVLSGKADFKGRHVAVIASGGNVDPGVFDQALQANH